MNPEDMYEALSSQSITDSNYAMEAYWVKERQR